MILATSPEFFAIAAAIENKEGEFLEVIPQHITNGLLIAFQYMCKFRLAAIIIFNKRIALTERRPMPGQGPINLKVALKWATVTFTSPKLTQLLLKHMYMCENPSINF